MKKNLLFSLVMMVFLANSQSNYQRKLFQTAPNGNVTDVVYTNEYNTTMLIIQNSNGSLPNTGFSTVTKFTTTTGNVTSSKTFSASGYDLAIKHVVKKNQMLFIVASLTNSVGVTGCIIKYNLSSNATVWRKTLAVNPSLYTLNSIVYDNDKYLYTLGSTNTTTPNNNLFVSKLDTNGNLIWIKSFGEGTLKYTASTILFRGNRELYLTAVGSISNTNMALTLRLDSSGTILNSNAIATSIFNGFNEKHTTIFKGKLVTIDKTLNSSTGDAGPFLIRALDTSLTAVTTKTLDGVSIKQIYSNNNYLVITGSAPVTSGFTGFRTIRLDSTLSVFGSRYFKKIITTNNTTSAVCYVNTANNSFHFFKPNNNDTVFVARTDIYEGVGCNDTAYVPSSNTLSYSPIAYTYTSSTITGTLSTITIPISTPTFSSSSTCVALTTNLNAITQNEFISLYPNPTHSVLMINNQSDLIEKFSIRDITGKEILADYLKKSIDVSSLQQGIYFVSFYDFTTKLIAVKKFIKE